MAHNKKYELTDEVIEVDGHILHRIRALKSFAAIGWAIEAGEIGGFIESEDNLSFVDGDSCWVYDDAMVYDHARVEGKARITGKSQVYGNAVIKDFAMVGGEACVGGQTVLCLDDRMIDDTFRKTPTTFYHLMMGGELQ